MVLAWGVPRVPNGILVFLFAFDEVPTARTVRSKKFGIVPGMNFVVLSGALTQVPLRSIAPAIAAQTLGLTTQ